MTLRIRRVVFLVAAAVLGGLLLWGFVGLPHFATFHSAYGSLVNRLSVPDRHVTDVVTTVNFDFRGFDTVVEEFIFFNAILGVALILRPQAGEGLGHIRDYAFGRAVPPTSDAVRVLGLGFTPPTVLFALYVMAHGSGFQGGVILATGVLLIYLAGEFDDLHHLYTEGALDRSLAGGAGAFIVVGFLGMIEGSAFLANVLPLGTTGRVFSGGMVPILNLAVGLEVGAGLILVLTTFLHQALMLRPTSRQP